MELVVPKCAKKQRQYPCSLDRYDEPEMGEEYDDKVNRDIAKYGVKDPAQSESLASEPDDVENNRDNRNGVYEKCDEFTFPPGGGRLPKARTAPKNESPRGCPGLSTHNLSVSRSGSGGCTSRFRQEPRRQSWSVMGPTCDDHFADKCDGQDKVDDSNEGEYHEKLSI